MTHYQSLTKIYPSIEKINLLVTLKNLREMSTLILNKLKYEYQF